MVNQTYPQRRWPDTCIFQALAQHWCADGSRILCGFIWDGYDRLRKEVLDQLDCSPNDEDLERSVTQLLVPRIRKCMSGDEPFDLEHGPFEFSTRLSGPGASPQPDMGFVWYRHPRAIWPIEAKVLRLDRNIQPYVVEVKQNLLSGRYAPFSTEGAMVGYLLSGDATVVFELVATSLRCKLLHHASFPDRDHKVSPHTRDNLADQKSPHDFCCHHMIMWIAEQGHE